LFDKDVKLIVANSFEAEIEKKELFNSERTYTKLVVAVHTKVLLAKISSFNSGHY